jgi:SWI/SNF chromatin-remodeling complex subunit SWI1
MMPGQGQQQNAQYAFQQFIKNVGALMAQHRRPFNAQPAIAGRGVNLQNLYSIVMRFKGHRYVTQSQAWPRVAQMMNIPPQQFPQAPQELQQIYEANLSIYEQAFFHR